MSHCRWQTGVVTLSGWRLCGQKDSSLAYYSWNFMLRQCGSPKLSPKGQLPLHTGDCLYSAAGVVTVGNDKGRQEMRYALVLLWQSCGAHWMLKTLTVLEKEHYSFHVSLLSCFYFLLKPYLTYATLCSPWALGYGFVWFFWLEFSGDINIFWCRIASTIDK